MGQDLIGREHPGRLHYAGRTYILRDGEQVWTTINMHRRSLYFCCGNFCVNILSKRLHVDDLVWDCGRSRSRAHVCPRRHCSWLLVREEALPCHRNLNMWFRIWDNCLRPSGDPTAGSVKLAVDQQDHRWILSLVHLPGPDHEASSKDQVREHRQYHRDETEQRADYQE